MQFGVFEGAGEVLGDDFFIAGGGDFGKFGGKWRVGREDGCAFRDGVDDVDYVGAGGGERVGCSSSVGLEKGGDGGASLGYVCGLEEAIRISGQFV